jgi:hypothetical protein
VHRSRSRDPGFCIALLPCLPLADPDVDRSTLSSPQGGRLLSGYDGCRDQWGSTGLCAAKAGWWGRCHSTGRVTSTCIVPASRAAPTARMPAHTSRRLSRCGTLARAYGGRCGPLVGVTPQVHSFVVFIRMNLKLYSITQRNLLL